MHKGYRDMESMKATRASRHSLASLALNLQETKNKQSVLRTMAPTNNGTEGIVGVYMQAMMTRLVGWKRKLVSVAISC